MMLIYHASKYRRTSSPWAIMLALNNNYTTSSGRMHIQCYSRGEREGLKYRMWFLKVNEVLDWWILSRIWPGRCFDKADFNEEWPVWYTFKDATHAAEHCISVSTMPGHLQVKRRDPLRSPIHQWLRGREPHPYKYFPGPPTASANSSRSHKKRNLKGCIKNFCAKEHFIGTKA